MYHIKQDQTNCLQFLVYFSFHEVGQTLSIMCSDLYTISGDEESPIVNSELQPRKQMIL